jgi:N-acetylglucosamine-6-phosphate deacetylase
VRGIEASSGRAVDIELAGKRISAVRETEPEPGLPLIAPGFLDLQVNGYLEADYSREDLEPAQVRSIVESLNPSGTTQHVPTIITSPRKRILRNLGVIAAAAEGSSDVAAALPGIHLEGPFISPEDGPRGAHDPAFVRPPDLAEVREWQEASRGRIRLVTLAPELDGALELIRGLTSMGIVPAIGHTAASPKQIREAVAAGAKLSTHLGNGSHIRLPRLRNYLWEQLAEDALMAGIIADGYHLPEAVLKVFVRAKGLERLILVSDVALFGGCPPGRYRRGQVEIEVYPDGHLGLPGTEILAGAAFTLDRGLAHLIGATGISLAEALLLCTRNPARLIGLPPEYATLAPGAPANLTLFDFPAGLPGPGEPGSRPTGAAEPAEGRGGLELPNAAEARLRIRKTVRAGVVVYQRAGPL